MEGVHNVPNGTQGKTTGENTADKTETTDASTQQIDTETYRFRVADYANLLKPRVMMLVVFTAIVGMVLAPGHIPLWQGIMSILCIAIGAGASGAINMWYDRDIDQFMARTQKRPIPAGKVEPTQALVFGVVLAALSVVVMYVAVNSQASGLLLFTILYYVFLYTMWLKRSTPQNIVIGGASGAFPPLIGWVSVTGDFSFGAGILFLIIFLWTPPHTWALALFRHGDYERVGVPMMPVVVGSRSTKLQMLIYTLLLVPVTLVPGFIGMSGLLYTAGAGALGILFIHHCWKLLKDKDDKHARPTFLFSILYLFLIFAFLLIDQVAWLPMPITL